MTKDQLDKNRSLMKSVAVIGGAKTGKTSLISRFLGQSFEERHEPTVEDYYIGKFFVGETLYHMEITDTSGSFEFPAMERLTMEKADAFIFVYSLDDEQSFERVKLALKRLREVKDISSVPIIVVCNKADLAVNIAVLRSMQMHLDQGESPLQCLIDLETWQGNERDRFRAKEHVLCAQLEQIRGLGCQFLLTSAKFRWNVNRIFTQLFTERKTETEKKNLGKKLSFTDAIKFRVRRKNLRLRGE